jgi:endonuclease V-like protein UPF0215 family
VKNEIRILGVDDAPFRKDDKEVKLVGVVFRNPLIDNVLSIDIEKDGIDSTDRLSGLILGSRSRNQIGVIMIDGINFAGINIVDIFRLYEETKIPVISIVRNEPDMERFKEALSSEKVHKDERLRIFKKYDPPKRFGEIYYHAAGIDDEKAKGILRISIIRSRIPEPVRIAHLIGQGMILGESRGRV